MKIKLSSFVMIVRQPNPKPLSPVVARCGKNSFFVHFGVYASEVAAILYTRILGFQPREGGRVI
jgi:hypothetical protein